jgi:hypothetical protein
MDIKEEVKKQAFWSWPWFRSQVALYLEVSFIIQVTQWQKMVPEVLWRGALCVVKVRYLCGMEPFLASRLGGVSL